MIVKLSKYKKLKNLKICKSGKSHLRVTPLDEYQSSYQKLYRAGGSEMVYFKIWKKITPNKNTISIKTFFQK
jgi:hypothetical protein